MQTQGSRALFSSSTFPEAQSAPVHSVVRLLPWADSPQVAQRRRLRRLWSGGQSLHPRKRRQRLGVVSVQLRVLCGQSE